MVFGGKYNEKYDWQAANNYIHVHVIGFSNKGKACMLLVLSNNGKGMQSWWAAVSGEDRSVATQMRAAKETKLLKAFFLIVLPYSKLQNMFSWMSELKQNGS